MSNLRCNHPGSQAMAWRGWLFEPRTLIFLFYLLVLGAAARAAEVITIIANPGQFANVEIAAGAEMRVNWWNSNDLSVANACTESFAAMELRTFLGRCLADRAEIRLAGVGEVPAKGDVFLIGSADSNPLVASFQPDKHKSAVAEDAESFRITAFRQDDRTITIIQGGDRVGALYGVYAYLEQLGVRFYGLGDRDTVMPAQPPVLPTKLDLSEKPNYLTRGFFAFEDRGDQPFFLWMARNRMNLWYAEGSEEKICFLKKLGMKLMAGHHGLQFLCLDPHAAYPYQVGKSDGKVTTPPDPYPASPENAGGLKKDDPLTYFDAHPEWYGLHNGKRSDNIPEHGAGDNYCTSNHDATTELAKNIVQQCIDGEWQHADLLNFWMTDFGRWCECDACQKQGSDTDRLLSITYTVRKALQTAQFEGRLKRNVQVATLAYHETLPPPSKPLPADFDYANCFVTIFPIERCYVHALADPACTEVNEPLSKEIEGWASGAGRLYTGSLLIGEYYNISTFKSLPLLFPKIMAIDIPWYYKIGARHFHYMHVPMSLWGTWRLNNYLMARLLWNVSANPDQILEEYFNRVYPTTTTPIRVFYRELEQASANFKAFKGFIYADGKRYSLHAALGNEETPLFPTSHLQYNSSHPKLNDGPSVVEIEAAMGRARLAVDEALINCRDVTERQRIVEDERRFAYGEATVECNFRLVRTAMFYRDGKIEAARREFALAERQAVILKSVVDLVQVSFSPSNAKDGFDAFQIKEGYEVAQPEDAYDHFKRLLNPAK